VRRYVFPLLLIAVALVAGGAAYAMEQPEEEAAAAESPPEPSATPLLSPRRAPRWLLQPGGDERLRQGVGPVIDQSPPDTCLSVSDHGRRILGQNLDLLVVPASNIKIVTARATLEVLGADSTYRTVVASAAPPADGVVEGDLYFIGGGDPVLSTADFLEGFPTEPASTSLEDLADRVVDAGITTVTGNVVGDDTRYDGVDRVPDWPERDIGTKTPGPLDALLVNRGLASYSTVPLDEFVPTPSTDAAGLAAEYLLDALEDRGVDVQGTNTAGAAPEGTTEIAGIDSPPMSAIVNTMLTESDNTLAELFLKEMAVHEGQPGTTAAGLEVLRATVDSWGLPTEGFVLADGSGLHDDNRITCEFLTQLLDELGPESSIAEGLPRAAESGTLIERMDGTTAGRIRAKTGTLREATALSGFASTLPGYDLTFTYIANADEVSEDLLDVQELFAAVLVQYPEGPAPADVAPPTPAD
jgi:D-alanyl-D-alanine carboxypeptidase/D-alanyl-D-alanine-endopeptidase (penicillin-binding protein 4)